MTGNGIDSQALRQARLRSEKIRILAIIAALATLFVFVTLRLVWFRAETRPQNWLLLGVFLATTLGYEGLMLRSVVKALRSGQDLGFRTWLVNVFVESMFPTLALIVLISQGLIGPYLALVAPAVLLYFIFIILSTLRLQPSLSRLTGVFSAGGYFAVAGYVLLRIPRPELGAASLPVEYYLTYTFIILLAGLIAGQVAGEIRRHVEVALREARQVERLKSDLEIARSIQQGLLPKEPPQAGSFEIAGWNKPADQTGGDYYGWQPTADGRIALTLADVTGHGIGSALVAAACHAYSRGALAQVDDLGSAMSRINRLLSQDLPSGKLVTFVAGVLTPGEGRMELLSAGHGPLFLYTASDDRVQSFDAHGVPFGVLRTMSYGPAQQIVLAAGDMLVLLTDGFFEWTNASDEDFGLDRLRDNIRSARDLPAAEVISRLYEAVTRFAGGTPQQDDLTAVVVKRIA